MIRQMAIGIWCVVVVSALSCGQVGAGVLDQLNGELAQIAKTAAPSVVEITGLGRKTVATIPEDGDWSKYFKYDEGKLRIQTEMASAQSVGSGFVIDAAGYILTTSDVARAEKLTVRFCDGTKAEGKVVGRDQITGVAVIKVEKTGLKPLPLGNSAGLEAGNLVVSVNSQAGLACTVSLGVVAGLDRKMGSAQDLIQISGTIGPGASGGPVLDSQGRVVGVTFAMFSPTSSALPFNVPKIIIGGSGITLDAPGAEKDMQALAEQMLELKKRELQNAETKKKYWTDEIDQAEERVRVGIVPQSEVRELKLKAVDADTSLAKSLAELQNAQTQIELLRKARPLSEDFMQAAQMTTRTSGSSGFAIPIDRIKPLLDDLKAGKEIERGWLGAMLDERDGKIIFRQVEKGSPADEGGLKAGDVLVTADSSRFEPMSAFSFYVSARKPGDMMKIVVSRDGRECEVNVKLGKRPGEPRVASTLSFPARPRGPVAVSIAVENASIAEVARKLADESGLNIIVTEPERIKKKVTVHLKSMTVEKALDLICRALGCQYKKDGDAYVISPK